MAYKTGNPIGSTDPRDLFDNAGILDQFANGPAPFYPDRFAVQRLSLSGMRYNFDQAQSGREAQFQQFLAGSGFEAPVSYAEGVTLERVTQTFVRDNVQYRIKDPADLPYTLTGDWDMESDYFASMGDSGLRQDLAGATGAQQVGFGDSTVAEALLSAGTFSNYPSYSAAPNADNSTAAMEMIAATNTLVVGVKETLIAKNLILPSGCRVLVSGKIKLPDACVDFDRLIRSEPGTTGLYIDINEIDGNSANQAGDIGTHLVYLNQPVNHFLRVRYAHDHYASTGDAPSPDGVRDSSSGAIFVYAPLGGETHVGFLKHWGREGVQIREGSFSYAHVRYAEGHETGGNEYSGIEVSGYGHFLGDSKVRWAGASGIGFDTTNGVAGNLVSIDTRENHGVNIGHTGFPGSGSVISSIVVDGAFIYGVSVGASTKNLTIGNVSLKNCGESCLNISDLADSLKVTNGFARHSGLSNANAYIGSMELSNVDISTVDSRVLRVQVTSGRFSSGENVAISGGGTGVVRKAIYNRSGSQQILFLSARTGSSAVGLTITGDSSTASGSILNDYSPVRKAESTGGQVVEDVSFANDGVLGQVTKFKDGTAIHRARISIVAGANTLTTMNQAYSSSVGFVEPPYVTASVGAVTSTDSFDVTRLSVTASATAVEVKLKASVAQTYSITVVSTGRWKS